MILSQLLMNGVIAGGIYALVALGFTMIFGVMRIIHFAHGEVFMIGAYIAWVLNILLGVSIFPTFLIAAIVCGFIGVGIEKVFYKPLRKKPPMSSLMVSIGLSLLIQSIIQIIFGPELKSFQIEQASSINFLGAVITPIQVIIILTSLVLMVLLYALITKTKIGKAVRASTDSLEVASVVGINTNKVISSVFFIGSALAGAAGVLVGIEQNLNPTMGLSIIIKSFTASVIGGVGNIYGAVAGGFLIGFIENVGIWFIPSGYKDAIAFMVLVLMLIFKPTGLFGTKVEEAIRQ